MDVTGWFFCNSYLLGGRGRAPDQATQQAAFERIRDQARVQLGMITGADPRVAQLSNDLTQAEGLVPAQLDQATTRAQAILEEARQLVLTFAPRRVRGEELTRDLAALPANPAGALPADIQAMDQLRNGIPLLLAAEFPTQVDLTQAAADLAALRQRIDASLAEIAARPAVRARLTEEHTALRQRMDFLDAQLQGLMNAPNFAQHQQELQDIRTNGVAPIGMAVLVDDPVQIQAHTAGLAALQTRIEQLDAAMHTDLGPEVRAQVGALNLDPDEEDALVAMGQDDVAAFAKARQLLDRLDAASGGGPATRQAVSTARTQFELAEQAEQQAYADTQLVPPPANAQALYNQAQQARRDRAREYVAIVQKREFLSALAGGPLSGEPANAIPRDAKSDMIDIFDRHHGLGASTVEMAGRSPHPEHVVKQATKMCDRLDAGFADANGGPQMPGRAARAYARRLTRLAANLPPEHMDGLDAYLDAGRHQQPLPAQLATAGKGVEEVGQDRVRFLTRSLLGANGALDFAGARAALEDLTYHPDCAAAPTAAQVAFMKDTLDWLEQSPQAQALIANATAPAPGQGDTLVRKDTGMTPAAGAPPPPLTADHTRRALLGAMLTPPRQGDVGSCFATGPVIKHRGNKPLETMQILHDLAVNGTFQPVQGDPVHAVTNMRGRGNALMRSFEYTLATAGARQAPARRNEQLDQSVERVGALLDRKIGRTRRKSVGARLRRVISESVKLIYDPERVLPPGPDGRSSHGGYILKDTRNDRPIQNLNEYQALIQDIVQAEVRESDTPYFHSVNEVLDQVNLAEFADAIKINGKFPWDLSGGGSAKDTFLALEGNCREVEMARHDAMQTRNRSDRAKEILKSAVQIAAQTPDAMSTAFNHVHAYNLLPGHADLDALKAGGPPNLLANIQAELVTPAQNLSNQAVATERLCRSFEKALNPLYRRMTDAGARAQLITDLDNGMPANRMTPAQYLQHVENATIACRNLETQARMQAWIAAQPAAPTAGEQAAEQTRIEDKLLDILRTGTEDELMNDLQVPHIVVADSNWGDASSNEYFVIAADPVLGEPFLGLWTEPPGKLSKMPNEADFAACGWYQLKEAP